MHDEEIFLHSDLFGILKNRYDNEVPQANMLARLFNMRRDEKDAITEKTMQAWLDGKAEPTGPELKVLQAWLGL
jgi:hypothetical protein